SIPRISLDAPNRFSPAAEPGTAQLNAKITHGPLTRNSSERPLNLSQYPFKSGERLIYDIGFQKSIVSGTVGQLELEVKYPVSTDVGVSNGNSGIPRADGAGPKPDPVSGTGGDRPDPRQQDSEIELKGTLTSKGFYTWVLGVNVQDTYQSIVSARDLSLSRFVKVADQSNQHRREETSIDRVHGLATYEDTDVGKADAQPKTRIVSCPPWVLDILSAFYFVRAANLREDQTLTIPLTDAGRVFNIDLVAGTHETVDFKSGKAKALAVDVRIFDGRYVKRSGQLTVWLSDDSTHVPVRARVKVNGLTINVVLERLPG
ncbi:MAG: DUF3108 domain-containing protein, partial [Blastocatellia bacterium]